MTGNVVSQVLYPPVYKPPLTKSDPPLFFSYKCPFELIFVAFCRSQHKDFAREEMGQKETNTHNLEKNYHFVTFSPSNLIHSLSRESKLNTVLSITFCVKEDHALRTHRISEGLSDGVCSPTASWTIDQTFSIGERSGELGGPVS